MRWIVLAFALLFSTAASAQCSGTVPNNYVCGNLSGSQNVFAGYPLPVITSAQLDAICSTNNDTLIRLTGTWQCQATGTSGHAFPFLDGTNIWSGSQYFGTGRPWCDPRSQGAVGDGSTNDSAAFKACRVILDALGGGIIYVSPGNYCLKTADANNAAIAINSTNISVIGAGINVSNLWTCGADIGIGYANVVGAGFYNLSYLGKGGQSNPGDSTFGASFAAFRFDSSCGICTINHVRGFGGQSGLEIEGFDSFVEDYSFGYAYGNAIIYIAGNGIRLSHGATDQSWPVVLPNENSLSINAWQSNHAYSGNGASNTNVVTTGGFLIQLVSSSCTSGGTAPTLQNYGTAITDGTCSWQLVAQNVHYGIDLDGGSGEVSGHDLDISCGGCTAGIAQTYNNATGAVPHNNNFVSITLGQTTVAGISLLSGNAFSIEGSHFAPGVDVGAAAVSILSSGTFTGSLSAVNNEIRSGGAIGFDIQVGASYAITGNRFIGQTTAIRVPNAIAVGLAASGNSMINVTTALNVAAGSSNYNFGFNSVGGAAVTYTSTDTNKSVCNNDGSSCTIGASWTPVITTDATVGTPAYTTQLGTYEQSGRQITARFNITLSGWTGSPTGNVEISGLPVANVGNFGTCTVSFYSGMNLTGAVNGMTGLISDTASLIVLYQGGSTSTTKVTATTNFTTTGSIIGSCSYHN